jgi:EmrB/QacA subfamily drug resistance transporter
MLFTWGVLGDRYGRKRILMIGLVLFGAASLATAFSQDPMQLIFWRGVMGIGGASVLPVTLAIITVIFPPRERGKAIGFWAAAVGGAVALGPVLGGFLLEHFWWGSVFLINVPIVIVGLVGIALLVPESRNPNPGRLDPLGVVLSVTGLLLLVYGLLHGGDTREWGDPGVWGPLALGVGLLALFFFLEARSDHPSLDLGLFKIRSFATPLASVSLAFAALSGTLIFLTFYLQILRGYSPLQAGLCIVPVALGQILAAPRSAKMVNRFGARRVISFGLIVVTLVFVGISLLTITTPLWIVLVVFFFLGFGLGNVVAPCTTRMTLAVPPARSGAGSAVQNTVRQVVAALGIAVIASIVAIVYATVARRSPPGRERGPQRLRRRGLWRRRQARRDGQQPGGGGTALGGERLVPDCARGRRADLGGPGLHRASHHPEVAARAGGGRGLVGGRLGPDDRPPGAGGRIRRHAGGRRDGLRDGPGE